MNKDGTLHPRLGEDFKPRLRWAIDDGIYPPHIPPQPKEEDTVIIKRRGQMGNFQERTDQTPEKSGPVAPQSNPSSSVVRTLSVGQPFSMQEV